MQFLLERDLLSGICYRKSVRLFVVCLSETFVRPNQPVKMFVNVSLRHLYPSHPLTSVQCFTEIAPKNRSVGVKRNSGSQR